VNALLVTGALTAMVAVLIAQILPIAMPSPSGGYGVGHSMLGPIGADAGAATPLAEIWYPVMPAAPPGNEPRPVLIYLPGWVGTVIEDRFLIRDLVSHGFVVASLRYPAPSEIAADAIDEPVLRGETPGEMDFSSQSAFEATLRRADDRARSRARNVTALIDRLRQLNDDEDAPLAGRLDLDRIGVWGYSFGGAAAAQAAWQDRRIKAAANLDGWLFAEAAAQGVPCPYFAVNDATPLPTEAELVAPDATQRYTAILQRDDYKRQLAGLKHHGGFLLTIDGTTHVNFSDNALRFRSRRLTGAGPIDPRRSLVITAAYLRGFFDSVLLNHPAALLQYNRSGYREARLRIIRSETGSAF
jgi:dienelactone hydrolase